MLKHKLILRMLACAAAVTIIAMLIPVGTALAAPSITATGITGVGSGPPASIATVSATSGFTPGASITITFSLSSVTYQTYTNIATVESGGAFTANVMVPTNAPAATYTVTATDNSSVAASTPFQIVPMISLSNFIANVGQPIYVTGYGFRASSAINVYYDGSNVTSTTSALNGSFGPVYFTVPSSANTTGPTHTVMATDGVYSASSTLTIQQRIAVTPDSGSVGSTVTISGTGFDPSRSVTISFGGTTLPSVVTDASGNFTTTYTVPALTAQSVTVSANDGILSASTTFTVTPAFTVTPTTSFSNEFFPPVSPGSDIVDLAVADNGTAIYAAGGSTDLIPDNIAAGPQMLAKSTDGGVNWTAAATPQGTGWVGNLPSTITAVTNVAVAPDVADGSFVAILATDRLAGQGVFISTNGGSSWTQYSDLNPVTDYTDSVLATTLTSVAISPAVGSTRYIAVGGTTNTGKPGLWYFQTGGFAAHWVDATADNNASTGWNLMSGNVTNYDFSTTAGTGDTFAVQFSPNFNGDFTIAAVTGPVVPATSANDSVMLQLANVNSKVWNQSLYPGWAKGVVVQTMNGPYGVNAASLALPASYLGASSSSRLAYVGLATNDPDALNPGAYYGGVYRFSDYVKSQLMADTVPALGGSTGGIYSVAVNSGGDQLVAGDYADNGVWRVSNPATAVAGTSLANAYLKPPSSALDDKVVVAYAGAIVVAGTRGITPGFNDQSAFSVSTNNGESFNDISLVNDGTLVAPSDYQISPVDFAVSNDGSTAYVASYDNGVLSVWARTVAPTWQRVLAVQDGNTSDYVLGLAPDDSNVLYVAERNGLLASYLWYTDDGGQNTWKPLICPFPISALEVESSSVLYAASTTNSISESTTSGFIWDTPTTLSFTPFSLESLGPGNLLIGGSQGQIAYMVSGNLTAIPPIPQAGNVMATADGLASGNYIYATSSEADSVYRWAIGGTAWQSMGSTSTLFSTSPNSGVAAFPAGIALANGALYVYADNGTNSFLYRTLMPQTANTVFDWSILGPLQDTVSPGASVTTPITLRFVNPQPKSDLVASVGTDKNPKLWALSFGNRLSGPTNQLESFVDVLTTASPALTSPPDGFVDGGNVETGQANDIVFTWSPVPGTPPAPVTSYELQISLDSSFTQVVFDNTVGGGPGAYNSTTATVGFEAPDGFVNFQADTTYYWRLRVFSIGDSGTFYSPFSTPLSFKIGAIAALPTPTTTTVSSSNSVSPYGQSVTLTATVKPSPNGGTVQLQDNGVALGDSESLGASGQVSYTTSNLSAGTHTITAVYSGDNDFGSSAGLLTQTVTPPIPTIASFSPASGSVGTSITIYGSGFTGTTAVRFGGTPAQRFTVNSNGTIAAVVGNGATGAVSVTGPGGTAVSPSVFTYNQAASQSPTVTWFTPTVGSAGTSVSIGGINFTGITGVAFGGVPAQSFSRYSSTEIIATVGNGATGPISVTTTNATAMSSGNFTFTTSSTAPEEPNNFNYQLVAGDKIELTWAPSISPNVANYYIYSDNGTGVINFANPVVELGSQASSWTTASMATGTYKFAIAPTDTNGDMVPVISDILQVDLAEPDLIISAVTTDPVDPQYGDNVTFHVTVRNQGPVSTTKGFFLAYYCGSTLVSEQYYANSISAGNQAEITDQWQASIPSGAYTLKVTVNTLQETVIESNDQNDSLSQPFTIQPNYIVTVGTDHPAYPSGDKINIAALVSSSSDPTAYFTGAEASVSCNLTNADNQTIVSNMPLVFDNTSGVNAFIGQISSSGYPDGVYTLDVNVEGAGWSRTGTCMFSIVDNVQITVATSKSEYDPGEPIPIYGKVTNQSGIGMADATVGLSLTVRGFEKNFSISTDSSGNYEYTYQPPPGEGGLYSVAVMTQANGLTREAATSFDVEGLYISPTSISFDMPKGASQEATVEIDNVGARDVTNLSIVIENSSANDSITHSILTAVPEVLASRESVNVTLEIGSGAGSPDSAALQLVASGDNLSAAIANINVVLHDPVPDPVISPDQFETGVNPGQLAIQTVTITNRGYGALQNVQVTQPSTDWIRIINGNIGNLSPSQKAEFEIQIQPPADTPVGAYETKITMNSSEGQLYVYATTNVTSSVVGNVDFQVEDDTGSYVDNATATLISEQTSILVTPSGNETYNNIVNGTSDVNGQVSFTNLPAGTYKYQVDAAGHDSVTGVTDIMPGNNPIVSVNMVTELVKLGFAVTPTQIPDSYSIGLSLTFETDVPKPTILAMPPWIDLSMPKNEVVTGQLQLLNTGKIDIRDLNVDASDLGKVNLIFDTSGNATGSSLYHVDDLKGGQLVTLSYKAWLADNATLDTQYSLGPNGNGITATGTYIYFSPGGDQLEGQVVTHVGVNFNDPRTLIVTPGEIFAANVSSDFVSSPLLDSFDSALQGIPWGTLNVRDGDGESSTLTSEAVGISYTATVNPVLLGVTALFPGVGAVASGIDSVLAKGEVPLNFWLGCFTSTDGQRLSLPYYLNVGDSASLSVFMLDPSLWSADIPGNISMNGGALFFSYQWASESSPSLKAVPIWIVTAYAGSITISGGGWGGGWGGGGGWWWNLPAIPAPTVHEIIKLNIPQTATLAREGFNASLSITPLVGDIQDVQAKLVIKDANGNVVNDLFQYGVTSSSGISSLDGTGTVTTNQPSVINWTIVPTRAAGGNDPAGQTYQVEATVHYEMNGRNYDLQTEYTPITVYPQPSLTVDYYVPHDVKADQPFSVNVTVQNDGPGSAHNFSISSAQPVITFNPSGLEANFDILGSAIGTNYSSGQMDIPFGDLLPGETRSGYWTMDSNLSGNFTAFSANLTQQDYEGLALDPLIAHVNVHIVNGTGGLPGLPTLTSLVPNSGTQGQTLTGVIVNGTNLTGATALTFSGSGITADNLSVNAAGTQITADVTITSSAEVGARDVTVTIPAGTSTTLVGGFSVDFDLTILGESINRQLQIPVMYPPDLLDENSFRDQIFTVWSSFTDWLYQTNLAKMYAEDYATGIDYGNMEREALLLAKQYFDSGDYVDARDYLNRYAYYEDQSTLAFDAASDIFDNKVEASAEVAEAIQTSCEKTVELGLTIADPAAAGYVDYAYVVVDSGVEASIGNQDQAMKDLIINSAVTALFNGIPFTDLGDETISQWVENNTGELAYPLLSKLIKSDECRSALTSVIEASATELSESSVEAIVNAIVDSANQSLQSLSATLHSPGQLTVSNSDNLTTGLVGETVLNEIPMSFYYHGGVNIFYPSDTDAYVYRVVGTGTGSYGLSIALTIDGETDNFTASNIDTTAGAVDQYTVDWTALSQGQEGVTVRVDSNGDGTFDKTFTCGANLTADEFNLKTETTVNLDPNTLNLKSNAKVVTAYIQLPTGYDPADIDVSTIELNGQVPALSSPTSIGDYNHDGIPDLMVKFDRSAVQNILSVGDNVTMTVTGQWNGTEFEGQDHIKVIK